MTKKVRLVTNPLYFPANRTIYLVDIQIHEGRAQMRVTRNYLSSLLGGNNNLNTTNSLLQKALSRSSKGRKANRASQLLNSTDNRSRLLTQNLATAAGSQKLYYNMKYHAGQTQEYADKLTDTGEDSVFAKAKESGDTSEIISDVRGFVSQYNAMLDNLRDSGTRTDQNYLTQLNNASRMSSSDLKACGVTRNADGTLTVDDKKLAAADMDTLERVWQGRSGFASRVSVWVDSVQSSAERNMDAQASSAYSNLFKNYGKSGNYFNYFQ